MMKSGDRSVERRRTRKRKRSVCGVLTAAATCFLTVAFPDATVAFVSRYVPFHGRLAASRTSGLPSEGRASLTEENETATWIRGDQTHATRMEQPAKDEESPIEDCSTLPEQNDYEPENSIIEASDPLSAQSFAVDLSNLAAENPQRAQDALEIMLDLFEKEVPGTVQPDITCYRVVMEGWIQANELEKANCVLDDMESKKYIIDLHRQLVSQGNLTEVVGRNDTEMSYNTQRSLLLPSEILYLTMIQAWADDMQDDFSGRSAERAEALLRRMEDRLFVAPSIKLWTMVLDGWCRRMNFVPKAMEQAERLLLEMEENRTAHQPNVISYTSFIGGLGRSKDYEKARKAEAILARMKKHGVEPDVVAYTSVINCWKRAVSRRERELAAARSLRLLSEMEHLYISKEMYHVKPSLITYENVIGAIGFSLDPAAPELAQDVLKRMYSLHESGAIANLKPTTSVYNAVIYAWSLSSSKKTLRYVRRAEQMLIEMTERALQGDRHVQPDVRTWAFVLRAWAESGSPDAAENAARVLRDMEETYRKGETIVRPNFVCYTTVMKAYAYSKKKGSLDKMESILKFMEETYEKTLESDIRPNTVSYVTAIDAFTRRNEKDAAMRAQAVVDRMLKLYSKGLGHVRPTRIVFNTLIIAWSKSGRSDSAQKAEKIFQWMEAQTQAGDELVKPDGLTLCAVLNAWAAQAEKGGAERAIQIWEHTKSMSAEDRGFPLRIAMPNIVIKAIARSKRPDAVQKSESILLGIEREFKDGTGMLRPDVTTYSSVINACAYYKGDASGRQKALETALRTYRKLSELENEACNNITYGTLFKAISYLMPFGSERDDLVRTLFDQCAEEGMVDYFVLSQVRNASPELFRDLVASPSGLGGSDSNNSIVEILQSAPPEWSANVLES